MDEAVLVDRALYARGHSGGWWEDSLLLNHSHLLLLFIRITLLKADDHVLLLVLFALGLLLFQLRLRLVPRGVNIPFLKITLKLGFIVFHLFHFWLFSFPHASVSLCLYQTDECVIFDE